MNLAPNGKPSNLTPEQYRLVRTPAFKKWFGDWENSPETASKVVDENGEPLAVYHGTKDNFSIFDKKKVGSNTYNSRLGFYFSNNVNVATSYTYDENDETYSGITLNCFLNIRFPRIIDVNNSSWSDEDLKGVGIGVGIDEQIKLHLVSNNYDGVIVKNISDPYYPIDDVNYLGNTYVVIEPNQIKLADGTNTTFDANNPDIRFKKGGQAFNDKELLSKWKRGESIGFTATSHLKAKGLIPRADGTKRKSDKYLVDGGELNDFVLYHGTRNAKKVIQALKDGSFIYFKSAGVEKGIYLTSNKKLALEYANDAQNILRKGDDIGILEIRFNKIPNFKKYNNYGEQYYDEKKYSWIPNEASIEYTKDLISNNYDGYSIGEVYLLFKEKIDLIDVNKTSVIRYELGGEITLTTEQVENKLGRKLHWWDDDVVSINGIDYKKVFLKPEYKRL